MTNELPARVTEDDIACLLKKQFRNATEIHVQFHLHTVWNSFNITHEGLCRASVEGRDVRRQFTAQNPIDLFNKISKNIADDRDYTDLLEEESKRKSLSSEADVLWVDQTPIDEPSE